MGQCEKFLRYRPYIPCTEESVACIGVENKAQGIHVCREHLKEWLVLCRPYNCAKCRRALGSSRNGYEDEPWPYKMKINDILHMVCFDCYIKMLTKAMQSVSAAAECPNLPDGMLGMDGDGKLGIQIPIV